MSCKNISLVKPDSAVHIISNIKYSIDEPDIELNITKEQFLVAVNQELADSPYVPSKYDGLHNPYTGKIVRSQADYEEYIREYTFHRLCEEGTVSAYNAKVSAELKRVEVRHKEENAKLRHRYRSLLLIACVALISSFIYIGVTPSQEEAYKSGYDSGYDIAKSDSESAASSAFNEGYNAAKSEFNGDISDAYDDGFNRGYSDGKSTGYDSGYAAGLKEGQSKPSSSSGSTSGNSPNGSSGGTTSSTSQTSTVYITESGSKYHRGSCSYLSNSKISISLSSAKAQGYTPCSRCNPPR